MTIQDTLWLLAHSKEAEDRRKWAVLYWKYQGLTHRQVGGKLRKGVDWVQRYMTAIYKTFNAPDIKDKEEKFQWLVDNVFPALKEFLEQYSSTLEALPPPLPEDIIINPPEPPDKTKIPVIEIPSSRLLPGPRPHPIVRLLRYVIFTLVALVVFSVVVYFAYTLGLSKIVPLAPLSSPTPYPTYTPAPTYTIEPTLAITDTAIVIIPAISATPAPPTDIPTYPEDVAAFIDGPSYIALRRNFNNPNGTCGYTGMDWGVAFDVVNDNASGGFLMRFNNAQFSATDDVGTQYQLYKAGFSNNIPSILGKDFNEQIIYHYPTVLCVNFQVPFSPQATYILIRAEWISGIGPIIFRKNL